MSAPPEPARKLGPKQIAYRCLGVGAVGLAGAGVVLPVLPTTPFLLVAVWAFSRSSPALADKLRSHPKYGPLLVDWETRRTIPPKAKAAAVVTMGGSWTGLALFSNSTVVVAGVGVTLLAVGGYILTRPSR